MLSKRYTLAFAFIISAGTLTAQFQGQIDGILGSGRGAMQFNAPFQFGWQGGLFYQLPSTPVAFGLTYGASQYAYSTRDNQPFFRDDYIHDVADITNTSNVRLYNTAFRFQPFSENIVSPFIELNGGMATYVSKWSAMDPFESHNSDCPGYIGNGRLMRSRTWTASAAMGGRLNLSQLLDPYGTCPGQYLVISANFLTGGEVDHLNARKNPDHFDYPVHDPKLLVLAQPHVPRASQQGSDGKRVIAHNQQADASTPFRDRHSWVQFKVGWMFTF
jgi:hypothetical protein